MRIHYGAKHFTLIISFNIHNSWLGRWYDDRDEQKALVKFSRWSQVLKLLSGTKRTKFIMKFKIINTTILH